MNGGVIKTALSLVCREVDVSYVCEANPRALPGRLGHVVLQFLGSFHLHLAVLVQRIVSRELEAHVVKIILGHVSETICYSLKTCVFVGSVWNLGICSSHNLCQF